MRGSMSSCIQPKTLWFYIIFTPMLGGERCCLSWARFTAIALRREKVREDEFGRAEILTEKNEWTIPALRENVFTEYNETAPILAGAGFVSLGALTK